MAWALGYVPLLNVPILLPESASNRSGIELTDADIFGVRFGPSGRVSRLLIDCKTTVGRAVDRVLWVKGLHTFLTLEELYLFKKRIPNNARWLAKELNVNCLDEEEIGALEERLGLHRLKGPYFDGTGYEQVRLMLSSFPKGSDYRAIVQFLTGGIWTLSPAKRVVTLTNLGSQNNLNRKLRPSEPAHVILVLHGALMLAISLGLLASQLNVVDTLNVEERLREELHGGPELLEQKVRYLDVLNRLSLESGSGGRGATIDLDGFPSLLEQMNRLIVRRYALNDATRVIDLALHYFAVGSSGLPGHLGGTQTPLPAKIASDILSLFVRSNELDEKFAMVIIALLEEHDDPSKNNELTQTHPNLSGQQVSLLDPLPPMESSDEKVSS